MDQINLLFEPLFDFLESVPQAGPWYTNTIRFVMPFLALGVLIDVLRSLLRVENPAETWGYLETPEGEQLPINHWENTLGRAPSSDVVLSYPSVSRTHAGLIRDDAGEWTVTDLGSKGGTLVNGEEVEGKTPIHPGDTLELGGVELLFLPVPQEEKQREIAKRRKKSRPVPPWGSLVILTLFQLFTVIQFAVAEGREWNPQIPLAFFGLTCTMWCYVFALRAMRRVGFEMEIIVFFLCTLNLAVTASAAPSGVLKEFLMILLGLLVFLALGWYLRDLGRASRLRYLMGAGAVVLFLINLAIAGVSHGARNWVEIFGVRFQPSELIKVAFVYAGAATLDKLFTKRNPLWLHPVHRLLPGVPGHYEGLRHRCHLLCDLSGHRFPPLGGFCHFVPDHRRRRLCRHDGAAVQALYRSRFAVWGHVWEQASDGGFQQTRTMCAAASGGLVGVGAGKGWLEGVFAADTDLVFGMLCEEWGLIIALLSVACIVTLAIFAVRCTKAGRSTFYTIAACAATSLLVFQSILNIFGSVDLLPLTGVTLPFVSHGGSSMISAWGLLAFLKAADTRQNASFAIKLEKRSKRKERSDYYEED